MSFKRLEYNESPEEALCFPEKLAGSDVPYQGILHSGKLDQSNNLGGTYKWIFAILFCALCVSLVLVVIFLPTSGYENGHFIKICKKQSGFALDSSFQVEETESSPLRPFVFKCRMAGGVAMLLPGMLKSPSQSENDNLEAASKSIQQTLKKEKITLADMGFQPSYDIQPGYKSRRNDLKAVPDAFVAYVTVTYGDRVIVVGPVASETSEDAKDVAETEALRVVLQVLYGIQDDNEGGPDVVMAGQDTDEGNPNHILVGRDDDEDSPDHVLVGQDFLNKDQLAEVAADQEKLWEFAM